MAGVPSRPFRPLYKSSTDTTIEIEIIPVLDNKGSYIQSYKVLRDNGDFNSDVDIVVGSFTGSTLTQTVSGLSPGVKYRFGITATNEIGESEISQFTIIAAASLPSAPTLITKDSSLSNKTAITVQWPKVPDTEIETIGYILYMAEYGSELYSVVYNGANKPQTLSHTVSHLSTGQSYNFKLVALNFNGQSLESPVYTFNICNVPVMNAVPYKIASTTTSITLGWDNPIDDGGCPITGFAIFRDDGAGSDIDTEVNTNNDPTVRDIPTLDFLKVTYFPASTEGNTFRF